MAFSAASVQTGLQGKQVFTVQAETCLPVPVPVPVPVLRSVLCLVLHSSVSVPCRAQVLAPYSAAVLAL